MPDQRNDLSGAHASPLPIGTPVRTWDGSTGTIVGRTGEWTQVRTDDDGKVWEYLQAQFEVLATEAA